MPWAKPAAPVVERRCPGAVTAKCDQVDVRVVWIGSTETVMCSACRQVAAAMGADPHVRSTDRSLAG